ncbi:AI-2E family transporter [bacterium]|nr:AI-2E family transporter [bacterium]
MFLKFFEKYFSIKNIIFTIVFILFITFLFKSKNISLIFFASFVIACSINPFVDKLSNKMPRNTATLLVIVSIICAFFAVFIPICILCTQEIKSFIVAFPEYIDKFDDYLLSIPILNKLDFTADNLEMIATSMSNSSSEIMNSIFDIGKNIGTAFVYLIFSMMIIYYLVTDKKILKDFYLKSFPVQMRKKAETIGVLISKKTGGYLIAQLTTILSVGIVMLIGLSIMNINYALLLAILTAVFDIIPVIGPTIALIICIIATYESGTGAVLTVLVVFSLAQFIENNFVRPYVFGKFLDIHPLVIFIFLIIAAEYLGVIGVVFAPALAAVAVVLYEELYLKNLN